MGGIDKKKIGIGAVVLIIVMVAVWQVSNTITSAEPLTAEEATNKVQELYSGDIVDVKENKELYLITIELDTGTYVIEINRKSGEIESMNRTKKGAEGSGKQPKKNQDEDSSKLAKEGPNDQNTIPTPEPEPVPVPTPIEPQPNRPEVQKQLTEQEAINIALNQLNGEVEGIELGSSGGVTYYLVEIEREEAEEEATIQINAISGEVMSVIWDD